MPFPSKYGHLRAAKSHHTGRQRGQLRQKFLFGAAVDHLKILQGIRVQVLGPVENWRFPGKYVGNMNGKSLNDHHLIIINDRFP